MSPAVRMVIGGAIGALVGYGMYRFIGCRSGACPLMGHPLISSLWWAVIGVMAAMSSK